jgi:hypothetical protein
MGHMRKFLLSSAENSFIRARSFAKRVFGEFFGHRRRKEGWMDMLQSNIRSVALARIRLA